jgi:murein DD-endopeptidase MepM/ murein hydrolase activator NlpD
MGDNRMTAKHVMNLGNAAVAIGLISLSMLPQPVTAQATKQDTSKLRNQVRALQNQMQQTRQELRGARRTESIIADELDRNQSALKSTRNQLRETKSRLARTLSESEQITNELKRCEDLLKVQELQLAKRLVANYRQGPVRYISVLLGSHSMAELSTRAQFVRSIVKHDASLIASVKSDRAKVVRWKKQVDDKAREIADRKNELGSQQLEEAQVVQRRRGLLEEAQQIREALEQELRDLAADSRAISARIRAMERTAGGKARLNKKFSGNFSQPADGPITSNYGMRFHPILKRNRMHTGIDIGAGSGSPIRAAAAGTVTFRGTMSGYGNVILIDHGGGTSTLYAHCSSLVAHEGQQVSQGQLIARVGSTGRATGPHLHFEVRRNGEPVNPR